MSLEMMCMEKLFAFAYLWAWDLDDEQVYRDILDNMFMNSPENELLLELEGLVSSYKESFFRIKRYFDYENASFDKNLFGKYLFEGLEKVYVSNKISIKEFSKRAYEIWNILPRDIVEEEPFFTLSYADDPLSWGDEKQTRDLYEKAFSFYKDIY